MQKLFNTLFAWALCLTVNAQTFHNPIIPGYHPDPSICRVGDKFYGKRCFIIVHSRCIIRFSLSMPRASCINFSIFARR